MRRFRVRRYGSDVWTFIEVRGDEAENVGPMLETALWNWTAMYHVQEWQNNKWEDVE